MRPTSILIALLLATVALAAGPDPASLVGGPLPDPGAGAWAGWERRDEWTIEEPPSSSTGPIWSWAVWTRPGQAALFLRSGDRVIGAVRVDLPEGWEIGTNCKASGAPAWTRDIVALVPESHGLKGPRCAPTSPRAAWRLDRGQRRIESIPVAGLTCQPPCPWD